MLISSILLRQSIIVTPGFPIHGLEGKQPSERDNGVDNEGGMLYPVLWRLSCTCCVIIIVSIHILNIQ